MLKSKFFWVSLAFAIIFVIGGIFLNKYLALQEELRQSQNNVLAYDAENSKLREEKILFQFSVDQLNYLNDSLLDKMNQVRKELGVKDKQIKQLQYELSVAHKIDTIVLSDTIFKDPHLNVDTTFSDNWYKLNLQLKYPSTIVVSPEFTSEKYVVISAKKEYIPAPKKFFLARWFQRKKEVIIVNITENNPYIENKASRFVQVIH